MKTRITALTLGSLILIVIFNIYGIVTFEQTIKKALLFGIIFIIIYFIRKKKIGK